LFPWFAALKTPQEFLTTCFARSGEVLSLGRPRESTQREGRPGALIGCADALRSSPLRGRAQLAISLHSIRSDRVRALFPDGLRYSVSADGKRVAGFGFLVLTLTRLALPSIAGKTGASSRPV